MITPDKVEKMEGVIEGKTTINSLMWGMNLWFMVEAYKDNNFGIWLMATIGHDLDWWVDFATEARRQIHIERNTRDATEEWEKVIGYDFGMVKYI